MVMTAPRAPLEMRRFPVPRPAPGGAIVETLMSEVCGTDVHLHHGRLSGVPYPIIPGHVSCGRLLETGGHRPRRRGAPAPRGTARHLLRRVRHLRRVLALPGGAGGDALSPPPRLRDHHQRRATASSAAGPSASSCGRACGSCPCRTPSTRWRSWAGAAACPPGSTPSSARASPSATPSSCRAAVRSASTPPSLPALSGAASVLMVGAPADRLQAARHLGVDDVLDLADVAAGRGPRGLGPRPHRRAAARTSSSRPPAIPPPFPRGWRCCATPAATSWSASTPTRATSPSIPTATSTGGMRRSWDAGATSSPTCTARWRSWRATPAASTGRGW